MVSLLLLAYQQTNFNPVYYGAAQLDNY